MVKKKKKEFEIPHYIQEVIPLDQPLSSKLETNKQILQEVTGNSKDIVYKFLTRGNHPRVLLLYLEGFVDTETIQSVLSYIMDTRYEEENGSSTLLAERIPIGNTKSMHTFQTCISSLLSGYFLLLEEGETTAIAIQASNIAQRSVSEPQNQSVIKGPQEAFNETLHTNIALVRKRIRHVNVWTEMFEIGAVTKTGVCMMYIKNLANERLVENIRSKLRNIKTDSILESGYIEELIEEQRFSLFPTLFNTERPDVIAADLLEGKIAIFVDGTPYVMSAPTVFTQFFQAAEDYYNRGDYGLLRLLRVICFMITVTAPSVYIALTTYHQEMLQTPLLISIAAQHSAIPFPALVEALLMQFTFEILREAGIRMPRAIGNAVSIVGALVLGEAAVAAGFVSPAMVIVISITALTTFISPDFAMSFAQRLLRVLLMFIGASFGLYGIAMGCFAILLHLCSLQSFGVPYMSPLAPFNMRDQQDTFFRFPKWAMKRRPEIFYPQDEIRTPTQPEKDYD